MLENAVYSVLSPEGFASILYKDASKHKEAAEHMKITANDLMELNVIDEIIQEPEGGAGENIEKVASEIKKYILNSLKDLVNSRYEKYRRIK